MGLETEILAPRFSDQLFIGGKWVDPSSSAKIDVVNPATEEVWISVAEATASDIGHAVAAARHAFDDGPWPKMNHKERAAYLRQIGERLRARDAELGSYWTAEVGATRSLAEHFVPLAAGAWDYYADLSETFPFVEHHVPQAGGNVGLLVREPVGVVAAIIPWNAPLSLITFKLAPALLAGCTVILKLSPEAPSAGLVIAEIAGEIGLPPGVLNVLTADRDVSEHLVRHPDVDKVTFTGSSQAGKRIASICGERVARVTLELGGKSPALILDDYDLAMAASSLAASMPILCGQVCSSLTRIIVSRHRQQELVEALEASLGAIRVGDPRSSETDMGPLAMRRQRDRVEMLIAEGVRDGATKAFGGARPSHLSRGFYMEPTVFSDVSNDMSIAREEIFGPVISVIPADSEDHGVAIANDCVFGLNASVFTGDADRAYYYARQIKAGTVGHNGFRSDFSIAFGGFKQSGLGREGGVEGLLPFLETKTIILDAHPTSL